MILISAWQFNASKIYSNYTFALRPGYIRKIAASHHLKLIIRKNRESRSLSNYWIAFLHSNSNSS